MGFFQNIGKGLSKITKGISLNNAIKVVSGSGGEVVKDFINRGSQGVQLAIKGEVNNALGGLKSSAENILTKSQPKKTFLQTNIEDALIKSGQQVSDKLFNGLVDKASSSLSSSSNLDALNNGLLKFGSAVWFKANWQKYKIAIIASGVLLVSTIVYFVVRKKPTYRKKW